MEEKIKVEGLAQLNKSLRAMDKDAPKQLRITLNDVASGFADRVKPEIPQETGAAARSVVARSTRTSARVAVGGRRAPYFPWLDYGGEGRIKGRPSKREFIRAGRYVYPTLKRYRPEIERELQEGLSDLIRDSGLDAS